MTEAETEALELIAGHPSECVLALFMAHLECWQHAEAECLARGGNKGAFWTTAFSFFVAFMIGSAGGDDAFKVIQHFIDRAEKNDELLAQFLARVSAIYMGDDITPPTLN